MKLGDRMINATPSNNAEYALKAGYEDNLLIFPVEGDPKSKRYKAPLVSSGFKSASSDSKQIESWWRDNPDAMIGMATGQASGIMAIDIDIKNGIDGYDSLVKLQEELGSLPETFTVETISGGMHLCFKAPKNIEIPCSVDVNLGIDVRSNGGYIILANSINTEGKRYEIIKNIEFAELPEAYIKYFTRNKSKSKILDSNCLIPKGVRNTNMTKVIGMLRSIGLEGNSLVSASEYFNSNLCNPPLDATELQTILDSIGQRDRGYAHTAIGNGERFADRYAHNVKCINGRGNAKVWMLWDGSRWIEDKLGAVNEMCKQIAVDLHEEAKNLPNNNEYKILKGSLFAHAKQTQNNPLKILPMASSDPKITIKEEDFDTNDYLLPCVNGLVDLKTGEFTDHDPSKFYTKQVKAKFDPNAQSNIWNEFISFFTDGDKEVEQFLARLYGGVGLIGANPEQKMIMLLGKGQNGKSSFNEVMQHLMSDYSDVIRKEVIMSRSNRDYRQDIADLKGARFITVTEPEKGSKLNGNLIKDMTGGDTIKGRQNYQDSETFKVKGLISLASNWEPELEQGDEALERRIIIYRHNGVVSSDKKDPYLVKKINDRSDAVLAWLYKGRMDYIECIKQKDQGLITDALKTPDKIKDMTKDFMCRKDIFKSFLIDECELGEKFQIQAESLYNIYSSYCYKNTEKPMGSRTFYEVVANQFGKGSSNGRKHYKGIKLKAL